MMMMHVIDSFTVSLFSSMISIVLLLRTEKHHERMTKYVQKATFVDYMWQSMRPPPSATTTDTKLVASVVFSST